MDTQKPLVNSRAVFGIILIILGGLFMLENYGLFDFTIPRIIWDWRSILIIIGLFLIITSRNRNAGVILIVIGGVGFLPEYWPVLLILLGLYIVMKQNNISAKIFNQNHHNNNNNHSASSSEDYLNDVAIFGGGKKIIQSENFKGGKITAIFGGSEIDLFDCTLADGVNYLDVVAVFGGTTLYVPKDWKVELDLVPIFGGFSDNRRKDPNLTPNNNKKLIIKGLVLFGGGEIKD
ncbi:MAG: LiaF domain-containing protein [bacterium]